MPERKENIADVLLNPVRMRIAQHLILHQPSTTQEINEHLTDIPKASLYRHLKKLTDSGFIKVVSENRIRGTVERVYALETIKLEGGSEKEQIRKTLESTMLMLLGEFERYLSREDADLVRDKLSMQTATLLLSDEEYNQFMREISLAYARVLDNRPNGSRKMRRVTLIVSPAATDGDHDKLSK